MIDREIASGSAIRGIARKFRVSEDALARHRAHVATAVVRSAKRHGERLEDDLLAQIRRLADRAWALLDKMEGEGDLRGAVIGLRETRETLATLNELLGRAGGEPGTSVSPEVDMAIIHRKLFERLLPEDAELHPELPTGDVPPGKVQ